MKERNIYTMSGTITKYVANDGRHFDTKIECEEYELLLEKVSKLVIDNPKNVLPYDVYVNDCDSQYFWVNLKNEDDIQLVRIVYGIDVCYLKPGIYCVEVSMGGDGYITSMEDNLRNAFDLLELAGYDTTTLKRKRDDDV